MVAVPGAGAHSPPPPPTAARPRVRWGFGDAVWVLVAGVGLSTVVGAIVVGGRHADLIRDPRKAHFDAIDTVVSTAFQYAVMLGLIFLLVRVKGNGARLDLGLNVRPADWWW